VTFPFHCTPSPDIGFGVGQEDRRRGQGRPTDIPPVSRPEPEAAAFNVRLPMHMKKVFQRAADIRHQTLTEFVLGSAYDRAMTTILDDAVLRLSERDGEASANVARAQTTSRVLRVGRSTLYRQIG
jgi:uncharacterized protein (DUF1778 family)